jgi:hypothetical protein
VNQKILSLIIVATSFVSCTRDKIVDIPPFTERLVVESYVEWNANRIIVRVDNTFNPQQSSHLIPEHKDLSNSLVQVTYKKVTHTLQYIPVDQLSSFFVQDQFKLGTYFYCNLDVDSHDTLKLTVDVDQHHLTSSCVIPQVQVVKAIMFKGIQQNGEKYDAFRLRIEADYPNDATYYHFTLQYTDTGTIGTGRPPYRNLSIAQGFLAIPPKAQTAELIFNTQSYFIYPSIGNYRVIISSIEKSYYDFAIAASIQFTELNSIIPSETTEIPSNIVGGYGLFTGICSDTVEVKPQ